jgi:two-component sensor histidine kinase
MRVPDIDPDFPAARWATYLREVTREGSLTFETRHKTKDGRIFPVEINTNYFKYNGIHYSMALVRDITERKNREEKICLLLHEVNHRAKNMLSVVAAIAKKTATTRPGEFLERFSERIQSLAASQDLFIESQWQRVDIEDLARAQLAHLRGLLDSRITLDGLPLHIAAPAAQLIGMALHELAANACMYGALSNSAGQVAIAWRVENDSAGASRFSLSWTENGGPPVVPPFRAGFGSIVLRELPQAQLDAEVQLDFAPTGLRWRLECPAEMLLEDTRGGPS